MSSPRAPSRTSRAVAQIGEELENNGVKLVILIANNHVPGFGNVYKVGMARRMPSSNNEPRQIFSLTVRLYYWCQASRGDIEGLIKERGVMISRDSMR